MSRATRVFGLCLAAGFGGVMARGGLVVAGEREFGELEVGIGALQDVAAALRDDESLFSQLLCFIRMAGRRGQARGHGLEADQP